MGILERRDGKDYSEGMGKIRVEGWRKLEWSEGED